jgi:hypothetical protein
MYGAGPTSALDNNEIYAAWLQKKVLFVCNRTSRVFGAGNESRARGPDEVQFAVNGRTVGHFVVYNSDFADLLNRGALLYTSEIMELQPGDIWELDLNEHGSSSSLPTLTKIGRADGILSGGNQKPAFVRGVEAGPFDPRLLNNWHYDIRFPLITAKAMKVHSSPDALPTVLLVTGPVLIVFGALVAMWHTKRRRWLSLFHRRNASKGMHRKLLSGFEESCKNEQGGSDAMASAMEEPVQSVVVHRKD